MARRKWYNGPGSTAPPHNSRNSRKSPKAPKTPKSAKIQPMEDLKPEFGGEPAKSPPAHESAPPKRPEKLPLNEHTETRAGPAGLHRQAPPIMEARSPPTSLPNPDSIDAAISGNPRSDQFRAFPTPQVQHPRWHQPWYPSFKVQDALFAAQYAYQDTLAQRLALSRDDMEPLSPQRSPDQDEEDRVQREMESLREQLREANSRADQAERAAEELTRQLRSSRSNEPVMDHNNLADTTTTLKAENSDLKAELDEARSHIFSLQPYRKDLTPKEVGQVSCFTRRTMAGPGLTRSRTSMISSTASLTGSPTSSIRFLTTTIRWMTFWRPLSNGRQTFRSLSGTYTAKATWSTAACFPKRISTSSLLS